MEKNQPSTHAKYFTLQKLSNKQSATSDLKVKKPKSNG